jgi:hypothetical protein
MANKNNEIGALDGKRQIQAGQKVSTSKKSHTVDNTFTFVKAHGPFHAIVENSQGKTLKVELPIFVLEEENSIAEAIRGNHAFDNETEIF